VSTIWVESERAENASKEHFCCCQLQIHQKSLAIPKVVEISSFSNPLEIVLDDFPTRVCQPALLITVNKDTTVWVDGARPPSRYVFKNNISLMSSKI
jgi:hypothetical protein